MKDLVVFGCSMPSNYVKWRNETAKKVMKTEGKPWSYRTWSLEKKEYIMVDWEIQEEFPTLDKHIAQHFGFSPKNFAYPGSSNLQIFNYVSDYIIKHRKNLGFVIVCWTNLTRIGFPTKEFITMDENHKFRKYFNMIFNYYRDPKKDNRKHRLIEYYKEEWNWLYEIGNICPRKDVNEFLRNIYMVQMMCKMHDIPCIQCSSITHPVNVNMLREYASNETIEEIDANGFFGFPIDTLDKSKYLFNLTPNDQKYRITEYDSHPSELHHKVVAEKLIQAIENKGIL